MAKIAEWKMHVLNKSMARYFHVTAPEGEDWVSELQTAEAAKAIVDIAKNMLGDEAANKIRITTIERGITLTFEDFAASRISEWRLFRGAVCALLVHPSGYV